MNARWRGVDVGAVPTLGIVSTRASIPSERGQSIIELRKWLNTLRVLTLLDLGDPLFKVLVEAFVGEHGTEQDGAGEVVAESGFWGCNSAHGMAYYYGAAG